MAGIKVPPHNEEAEQSVLGAILIDKDAISIVSEIIKPSIFTAILMGLFIIPCFLIRGKKANRYTNSYNTA